MATQPQTIDPSQLSPTPPAVVQQAPAAAISSSPQSGVIDPAQLSSTPATTAAAAQATDTTATQYTYPAGGPGAKPVTVTLPKWKADQLEQQDREARINAGEGAAIFTATQGLGELVGPALEYLGVGARAAAGTTEGAAAAKQGTGILDEFGNEIFKDVAPASKQFAWKILQNPTVQKAIKQAARGAVGAAIGEHYLGDKGGVAGFLSPFILRWLLKD